MTFIPEKFVLFCFDVVVMKPPQLQNTRAYIMRKRYENTSKLQSLFIPVLSYKLELWYHRHLCNNVNFAKDMLHCVNNTYYSFLILWYRSQGTQRNSQRLPILDHCICVAIHNKYLANSVEIYCDEKASKCGLSDVVFNFKK